MPPTDHDTSHTTHDPDESNDVEMQAVHDSNDTDDSASSIPPHEATASRINRRARVDDDDDDERDRRHPSQRIATNSTPSPTPRQHPSATDPRIHTTLNIPAVLTTPVDTTHLPHRDAPDSTPAANDDDNNNTAAGNNTDNNNNNPGPGPAPPPFFGGVAITIDLDGIPTMHPFPQGADGVPILPHFPPLPPMGMGGAGMGAGMATGTGFAAFRDFLTLLAMGGEREVEDPERAKRLVDALEEVPEGLVRRLEALGTGTEGGEVGCAICWDRLLDGEGGGFGSEEKEKEQEQEQTVQEEQEPSSTDSSDPSSSSSQSSGSSTEEVHESESKSERHHPKIVSLPCAHVFHAPCLIPWFARPRQTTCPTCRFNVDPEGLSATPRQWRRRAPANANAPGMGMPGAGAGTGAGGPTGAEAGTGEALAGEGDDTRTEDAIRVPEEFQQRIHERQERELAELLEADSQEQANGDDSEGGGQVPTAPPSEDGNNGEGEFAIVMMEMDGATDDAGTASFVFAPTETETEHAPAPAPGPAPAPRPRAPQHGFITIGFDVFIRGPPVPMPMGFGQGPGFTFTEGGAPAPQMGNMGGTLPGMFMGMNPAGANPDPNPDDANIMNGLRARMGMGMEDLEAEAEAIMDMDIGIDMGMGMGGTMGAGAGADADADAHPEDAGAHPPPQHQPPHIMRLPAWPGFGGAVRTGNGNGNGNAQFAARSVGEAFASLFGSGAGTGAGPGMGAQPTQGQAGDGESASAPGQAQGQAQPQTQGQGQLPPLPFGPVDRGQIPQDFFAALFGQLGGQRPPQVNTNANANASENSSQDTNREPAPATTTTTDEAGPEPSPSPAPAPAHPDPTNAAATANANPQQQQQRQMPHPLASLFPLLFNPFAPTGVRMRTDANPTATGNINLPPPPPPLFTMPMPMPGMHAPARERKAWTLPPAPGPTLRQRIERREREAGLRCSDVSCGVGPSDEEPVVGLSEAARRQLWIRAPGEGKGMDEGGGGGEGGAGLLCAHTFHPACLVSAARVGMRGAEAAVVREGEEEGGAVEVACSVCRGVGNVAKGDWDEGVQALA